jgi:hypothetical protein
MLLRTRHQGAGVAGVEVAQQQQQQEQPAPHPLRAGTAAEEVAAGAEVVMQTASPCADAQSRSARG